MKITLIIPILLIFINTTGVFSQDKSLAEGNLELIEFNEIDFPPLILNSGNYHFKLGIDTITIISPLTRQYMRSFLINPSNKGERMYSLIKKLEVNHNQESQNVAELYDYSKTILELHKRQLDSIQRENEKINGEITYLRSNIKDFQEELSKQRRNDSWTKITLGAIGGLLVGVLIVK